MPDVGGGSTEFIWIKDRAMIIVEILDYFGVEEFVVIDRGIQFGILMQDKKIIENMLFKG